MEELKFHEVAGIFPMMGEDELQDLADDIAKHGLREPICVDVENRIVDGRNRYVACKRVGAEMRFFDAPAERSLVEFVLSLNLRRWHLTSSELCPDPSPL
jgi:ParB-like chromosome segregation protein Spo0J